jgi:Uri superfamily endonuclease
VDARLRGTYALILYLPQDQAIRVGALGKFKFPRGLYIYVGSAMNGLNARIARHGRRRKKLFWHIDYILRYARIVSVETRISRRRLECRTARQLLSRRGVRVIAPRLGASDCNCPTHLIHFPKSTPRSIF